MGAVSNYTSVSPWSSSNSPYPESEHALKDRVVVATGHKVCQVNDNLGREREKQLHSAFHRKTDSEHITMLHNQKVWCSL